MENSSIAEVEPLVAFSSAQSNRLAAVIQDIWPQACSLLRELVEENSYTLNAEGVRENARRIVAHFAPFGFRPHLIPSRLPGTAEHLFLDSGGSGPAILLISHLDTVYLPEEQQAGFSGWDDTPNRVSGPGTYDIKGGTVAIWMLVKCLMEEDPESFSRHRWILGWNASEEMLVPDFSEVAREIAGNDLLACLVFEGDNRRQEGLEIITARSGLARFQIRVKGRSSHSGNSHASGINAIVRLAEIVGQVSALTDYGRHTTVNVGVISGGVTTNRVPDFAEAMLEVRYRDSSHFAEVKTTITGFRDDGGGVDTPGGARAEVIIEISDEIPFWPEAAASRELTGLWIRAGKHCGHPVSVGRRSGLSDANYFASHYPTLDGLGPRGGNAHTIVPDGSSVRITEFIDLASLKTKTLVNATAVLELIRKTL